MLIIRRQDDPIIDLTTAALLIRRLLEGALMLYFDAVALPSVVKSHLASFGVQTSPGTI